ncbi:MAG: M28 family peptidase [Bacteroidales bacterium]|nr:M28 family peptidase [Bacteroidales bacterium]
MIADLARYFAQNPAPVSLLFIAFSAEETGLEGSKYYAQNPLVPLDSTLFSLNLDIIGSGSTGITVVNGAVLPEYFSLLTAINEKNTYVKNIGKRGEAANSDHYFLYKNGVPAFFIYTTGEEYTEYHNVNDRAEGLPLTAYTGLFGLVRDFVLQLPISR